MEVLALTHAHLNKDGLSPVSCERADSIVGTWANELHWNIDVIHTTHTKWRGIWPDGSGLKVNIITVEAPSKLMSAASDLFLQSLKVLIKNKRFTAVGSLIANKLSKKIRHTLSENGVTLPAQLVLARKWGRYLLTQNAIRDKKYDFIFVCVGYGDEYLLETALAISQELNVPMVVDLRDLWSDHHDPARFTDKQRKLVRKYEKRVFKNAFLLSVPQKPMMQFLDWTNIPIHFTSHSAHVEPAWGDGQIVKNEFRILYAGKLYPGSVGLNMFLKMLQRLSGETGPHPVKCHFFVDDTEALNNLVISMGIQSSVVIHGWISPAQVWQEMRSAHLLITFDTGISMPLIMTKAYQYAHTGRPILALYDHKNETYVDFFKLYNSGAIFYNVDDATEWVKSLMSNEAQFEAMPQLRKIPFRNEIANELGKKIEQELNKK